MCFHPGKSLFSPVFLQPRSCGLTNGSTRSSTWRLTPSILSSYWLIVFPDTPHLWKRTLVSRISQSSLPPTKIKERNLLIQTRFLWWLQPLLCCCWLLRCSSSSSYQGPCESLKSFSFRSPFRFFAAVYWQFFCRCINVQMQVILLPHHLQPLEQQNGPLADEPNPPGHLIQLHLQLKFPGNLN